MPAPIPRAGPRLDTEQVAGKLVVHNYGHGGSGWSLSWGSATVAVRKAMQASQKEIAVIGCGALGLTSAIVRQGAGAQVTIYARDMLPDTRSARATGSWTPTSRIALDSASLAGFPGAVGRDGAHLVQDLSALSRPSGQSGRMDRPLLYERLSAPHEHPASPAPLDFADYAGRIRDIMPAADDLPPGSTPFPVANVRRTSLMQFNIADYGHTLMSDFLAAGGKFVRAEFGTLGDVSRLREKVVI